MFFNSLNCYNFKNYFTGHRQQYSFTKSTVHNSRPPNK